eukprot:scpid106592/ scgid17670/ 
MSSGAEKQELLNAPDEEDDDLSDNGGIASRPLNVKSLNPQDEDQTDTGDGLDDIQIVDSDEAVSATGGKRMRFRVKSARRQSNANLRRIRVRRVCCVLLAIAACIVGAIAYAVHGRQASGKASPNLNGAVLKSPAETASYKVF